MDFVYLDIARDVIKSEKKLKSSHLTASISSSSQEERSRIFVRSILVAAGVLLSENEPVKVSVLTDRKSRVLFDHMLDSEIESNISNKDLLKNIHFVHLSDIADIYSDEVINGLKEAREFSDQIYIDSIGQLSYVRNGEFKLKDVFSWAKSVSSLIGANVSVSHISLSEDHAKTAGFNSSTWIPGEDPEALTFVSKTLRKF